MGSMLLPCLLFAQTFTFQTPGTSTFTVPNFSGVDLKAGESILVDLSIIVVGAGGGGGAGTGGSGGGGGQVQQFSLVVNEGDQFTVSIGAGGAGGVGANPNGQSGGSSIFRNASSSINFISQGGQGGFRGGGFTPPTSAGGNSGNGRLGGQADIRNSNFTAGGGGAGAGAAGLNGSSSGNNYFGGNGGAGIQVIEGGIFFGGGGGGSAFSNSASATQGSGGQGGGGNASTGNGSSGTDGLGGGGGAGNGNGGRGGHGAVIITVDFRLLPVELVDFRGAFDPISQAVHLHWKTAKEWENSHFEIERAINQIQEFTNIGEVRGAGFSDTPINYNFTDYSLPFSGGMAYYRLKQIDFDGSFAYSEVIGVRLIPRENIGSSWKAYPNPTNGQNFRLEMNRPGSLEEEGLLVKLTSTTGRQIIFSGMDIITLNQDLRKSLENSTNGVYILEMRWGNQVEHHKILKQ